MDIQVGLQSGGLCKFHSTCQPTPQGKNAKKSQGTEQISTARLDFPYPHKLPKTKEKTKNKNKTKSKLNP